MSLSTTDGVPVRVDARTERWREHRLQVRETIVDAALRALSASGPDISLREIAAELGTAKPKLYRHFADKSDIFMAIADRVRDTLWDSILDSVNIMADPSLVLVHKSVEKYAAVVNENPNVIRFLVRGHFTAQAEAAGRPIENGRAVARSLAKFFSDEIDQLAINSSVVELGVYSILGCVASATDWWIGPAKDSERLLSREDFIENVTAMIWGVISGCTQSQGLSIDPDKPLHLAIAAQG
ncbi:MAG: TetR/AcrR family transcriptional regulator [Mycobacteriaceae bacterium]